MPFNRLAWIDENFHTKPHEARTRASLVSTFMDSTNHGSKIFEKISRKFHKAKLEFAALATIYVAFYSVLGSISNLEMTMYMEGCMQVIRKYYTLR